MASTQERPARLHRRPSAPKKSHILSTLLIILCVVILVGLPLYVAPGVFKTSVARDHSAFVENERLREENARLKHELVSSKCEASVPAAPVAASICTNRPEQSKAPRDVPLAGQAVIPQEQERARQVSAADVTSPSGLHLVTMNKEVQGMAEPQGLTYVVLRDGRTYYGPKAPDITLSPEYRWDRCVIAARDPGAPNGKSWIPAWVLIRSDEGVPQN